MRVPLLDLKAQYATIKDEILQAISEVCESQYFALGPAVEEFEKQIASYCKCKYAIGVSSGTDALLISLMALDIKPGDEVITTPMTCTATNLPLLARGVTLRWADVDARTMNIDPNSVLPLLTSATKCVVAVNLGGIPHDLHATTVAGDHVIPIVTDAAQSLGQFNGDYVANSFQAIKHITTGDGGMLTVPDLVNEKNAKLMLKNTLILLNN